MPTMLSIQNRSGYKSVYLLISVIEMIVRILKIVILVRIGITVIIEIAVIAATIVTTVPVPSRGTEQELYLPELRTGQTPKPKALKA